MKARKEKLRALSARPDIRWCGPRMATKIDQTDITAKAATSGRLR
jgi:hypothetical protein